MKDSAGQKTVYEVNELKTVTGLCVMGAIGLATAANAQAPTVSVPTQALTRPFTVKLGAYFPTSDRAKDAGDVMFAYGLSYDFVKTRTDNPVVISAFLDGAFGSKDDHERRVISIGPSARYYFSPPVQPVNFYAGAGISINFLHGKDFGDSQSNTRLGGKIFAGAEFGGGFLGELSYDFPGNVRGDNFNGIGLKAGYRF